MSERSQGAFNPKIVFALLLFGALAFFATLYFIGSGQTGGSDNDGQSHAASRGLTGYAALAEILEKDGHEVSISRNQGTLTDYNLLVLTPTMYADPAEVAKTIADRRYEGPTILILPKWNVMSARFATDADVDEGWVALNGASEPRWAEVLHEQDVEDFTYYGGGPPEFDLDISESSGDWSGLGRTGKLPRPDVTQAITNGDVSALVSGLGGNILVGFADDGGIYPTLDEAAGIPARSYNDDDYASSKYALVIVAEPDLFNNYGMADEGRADLAHAVFDAAMDGENLDIVFDVTLNGLGRSENLLTLAFTPPFLAATLCLIIAMIVVAWRAFRRFGPPVAEGRAIAFGKTRLVQNSAGFIQRTRRLHLLSLPYAEMMRARIGKALGLKNHDDEAIEAALARRLPDEPPFGQRMAALRNAQSRADVIRAADALKSIERKLAR
ncbi:DUF4350 domain-containing protein [Erythrobacter sp. HKB08]|uniref:DUF4350 domain-containing protein n=1 Tax=Erythrobacter sp. HKB08 TaxID=2502843 RepID=UPI0010089BEE|nr:DUF4350 domain-containing protein [Erythrobacter sp. HKB08]